MEKKGSSDNPVTVGQAVPELLVSVRSVPEAAMAITRSIDWLDIKDPAAGSLGMAESATIQAILALGSGRVSIALGELVDWMDRPIDTIPWNRPRAPGARNRIPSLAKVGLAGALDRASWTKDLASLSRRWPDVPVIPASYAEFAEVACPEPENVIDYAATLPVKMALIDTAIKNGRGSIAILGKSRVAELLLMACERGVRLAWAGALSLADVEWLLELAVPPAVIAVRGLACRDCNRRSEIDPNALDQLLERWGRLAKSKVVHTTA